MSALPDCQNTLHVRTGNVEAVSKFCENMASVCGGSLQEAVDREKPDLIFLHNTPKGDIPKTDIPIVYYAHSQAAVKDFPGIRICVSRWLADRIGWDQSTVLYQPVTLPLGKRRKPEGPIRVGRLCTPTPKKWKPHEWLPHMQQVRRFIPDCEITLVGIPQEYREEAEKELPGVVCLDAAPERRSLLWEWDVLLYTAGLPESFGRVVREAQRCGCFPVVSKRGGFIEQIERPGESWGYGSLIGDDPEEAGVAVKCWADTDNDWGYVKEHGDREGSLQSWREKFLKLLGEKL